MKQFSAAELQDRSDYINRWWADAAWLTQATLFHNDQLNRQLKRIWRD